MTEDPETTHGRRRNMAAIRSKNTKPELLLRKLLHAEGYRFRLHVRDLPGCPDLVFTARKAIVELRGCFWHAHGCELGKIPRSRREYWETKLLATRTRDHVNMHKLQDDGWRVYEVWECELKHDSASVIRAVRKFLGLTKAEK